MRKPPSCSSLTSEVFRIWIPQASGAIVGAYVSAQKAQRRIALTGMNERLRALVELNRLSKILAMYTSIADAETALH